MKARPTVGVMSVAGAVLLALLSVFAIKLADTQAKSRQDVEKRFRDRAVLTATMTQSLFQAASSAPPTDVQRRYLLPKVTQAAVDAGARRSRLAFIAVLDGKGRILAASAGITPAARAQIAGRPAVVRRVLAGRPLALSDILAIGPHGRPVLEYAQILKSPHGPRIIVSGFQPGLISAFLGGYLGKAPSLKGGSAYVLDSRSAVVGGAGRRMTPGAPVPESGLAAALRERTSGPFRSSHSFVSAPVGDSTWRVVLTAPDDILFSPVTGSRKWIPWIIFGAFALAGVLAVMMLRRAVRATRRVSAMNARLETVNRELEVSNGMLARRAAELMRSNAELEQFASIASHDLQEPLRKVRTFADHVSEREGDNLTETGRDYLRRLNSAAERMQDLIDDLLRFSRVATHGRPFAPVDLDDVVDEVLQDLETAVAHSGAQVHVEQLPTIHADPLQMRQLFQNLLSNAIKFRRPDVPPEIGVSAAVSDGLVEITVRDNGIGFDPKYRTRIFRVFERLHARAQYPGTGIGLALCRKIAERHGGKIVADGAPGVGSMFSVTLPVDQAEEVIVVPTVDGHLAAAPEEREHVYG